MKVNNGIRVWVALSDYTGRAGFVDRGETASLAYFPDDKRKASAVGSLLTVGRADWIVTKVKDSEYLKGCRVVLLRRADA